MLKVCPKCKKELHVNNFYKYRSSNNKYDYYCKSCRKSFNRTPIAIAYQKDYALKNKDMLNQKSKIRYYKNIEKEHERHHKWYLKNKDKVTLWGLNNPEKVKLSHRNYKLKNRQKIQELENIRRKIDSDFKITTLLRARMNRVLKNNAKSNHTLKLLGCSIEDFKQHLQMTALKNGYKDFNINKYLGKKYEIHHIVPCHKFNLSCSYHQKLCFNWSNMEILSIEDHDKKHKRKDL